MKKVVMRPWPVAERVFGVFSRRLLVVLFSALLLAACATHELVMSKTLQPALARPEVDFQLTLFRARVQMDRLEVWGRVARSESEYNPSFDLEIGSVANLAAALTNNGLIFDHDWRVLHLHLVNEYGSQQRWKTANGWAKLVIERDALLALRDRGALASEYPGNGMLTAHKAGPPDFVHLDWAPESPVDTVEPRD